MGPAWCPFVRPSACLDVDVILEAESRASRQRDPGGRKESVEGTVGACICHSMGVEASEFFRFWVRGG